MTIIKLSLFRKLYLHPMGLVVGFGLALLSLSAHADNFLDLGCLSNYQALLKPVDSLEVSAMPAPIKIKMAGVKSYSGDLPAQCQGQVPLGTFVKIFSLNNKLYSLDLTIKTSKPYYSQFIQGRELSRMEASLRRNNYAIAEFSTSIERDVRLGYQIEIVLGGFLEHLVYRSPESAKYE